MKHNEIYKIIMAIATSILKSENKTLIVSPNEDSNKDAYDTTLKYLSYDPSVKSSFDTYGNKIEFTNGSSIEFVVPSKPSETIRGKRADISHWYFDYEEFAIPRCIVDEVLEAFVLKQ